MLSIFSLILIITLSIFVTRVASILLVHTGLSRESARFQSRSAFTGVGFTTEESEKIVRHPVRRRIIFWLMLLGNAGVISAIATLLLTFLPDEQGKANWLLRGSILIASLVALWFVANSLVIDRWLSGAVSRALRKWTDLNVRDYAGLLHLAGDYQVTELIVNKKDWLANRTLKELSLRNEGIQILGIERKNGDFVGVPFGDTRIFAEDLLILYGRDGDIKELDRRRQGKRGEVQHKRAVDRHQSIVEQQMRINHKREREKGRGKGPPATKKRKGRKSPKK